MNPNTPDYWDLLYTTDRVLSDPFRARRAFCKSLYEWCAEHAEGEILDIGCGNGPLLYALNDEQRDHYRGVDFSPQAIDTLLQHFPELTGRVACTDFRRGLPYKWESYDTVIMSEILEHLPQANCKRLIKEAARVLKTGGKFLITVPIKDSIPTKAHITQFDSPAIIDLLIPYATGVDITKKDSWYLAKAKKWNILRFHSSGRGER